MHLDLATNVKAEVNKLVTAGFILKLQYPVWPANTVPSKKKNGQVQVCIDFQTLTMHVPKMIFGPSNVVTYRCNGRLEALSFMDGSSRYNQTKCTQMKQKRRCFDHPKVMPFGLKNAVVT